MSQAPILSLPDSAKNLRVGDGTDGVLRVRNSETSGVFSVIELISQPGKGVDVHVHEYEDELVHVLDGEIEVTLGDQKMRATAGIVALLPRGIPHGYVNVGDKPSRVFDVILPGGFGDYFIELDELHRSGRANESSFAELERKYSVQFGVTTSTD